MKTFTQSQLLKAYDHAAGGGQALHLMSGSFAFLRPDTPSCFKGRAQIAHLFDQDRTRLEKTARKLGVRKILVERIGQRGQHVDLCGKPLDRALDMASTELGEKACDRCQGKFPAADLKSCCRCSNTGTGNPAVDILALCDKCSGAPYIVPQEAAAAWMETHPDRAFPVVILDELPASAWPGEKDNPDSLALFKFQPVADLAVVEFVPAEVSQMVDAHERGDIVISGGRRMGKTLATKILMAKNVKEGG